MSILSKYIDRQVKKRGVKGFILWIIGIVAKATPTKKDDQMVAEIKILRFFADPNFKDLGCRNGK